jgi:hypothetical protein
VAAREKSNTLRRKVAGGSRGNTVNMPAPYELEKCSDATSGSGSGANAESNKLSDEHDKRRLYPTCATKRKQDRYIDR